MKRFVKKIIGISFSLMLLFSNGVCTMAASNDTMIKMSFPTSTKLSLKPFATEQINSVSPAYFYNFSQPGENIIYSISIAGYTCVATSNNDDSIKVVQGNPHIAKRKCFSASLQLGQVLNINAMTDDFDEFQENFEPEKTLDITILHNDSYDGRSNLGYKRNPVLNDSVDIGPQECVPFRITGQMNETADWVRGDKITIVPVFQIKVTTR